MSEPEGRANQGAQREPEPYRHVIRVRWGEVDMQQVVFNAHYLAYCDDAMEGWLRHLDVRGVEFGWDFMLKKASIEWQGSATAHDHLDIDVAVERWGRTSFDVGFTGMVRAEPVFTCTITYVGVEHGTATPAPPPPEVRARLGGPAG